MLPSNPPKIDKRHSERVDTETRYLNTSISRTHNQSQNQTQKENMLSSTGSHPPINSVRYLAALTSLLKTFEETQSSLK